MGFARLSRKRKCQRAWYGCQEIEYTEHPVLLQPDPGLMAHGNTIIALGVVDPLSQWAACFLPLQTMGCHPLAKPWVLPPPIALLKCRTPWHNPQS